MAAASRKPRIEKQTVELVRDEKGRWRKPAGFLDRLLRSRTVTIKRDCITGQFVSPERRALGCAIQDRRLGVDWTRPRADDRADRVCYTSKGAALRVFIAANSHITETWGLDTRGEAGEFDAINERYGLRGKRRVVTLKGALWVAMPAGRPYCLDRIDLDALNETVPARDGAPFRLPDVVHEHRYAAELARGEFTAGDAGDEVPF